MGRLPEFSAALLDETLATLARFSGPGPGVTRLAYDASWCEAQRWLAGQAETWGLHTTVDAAGNLFAHDSRVTPGRLERPVLMVGSHLDSVAHGGRYDGAYGAVAGLMVAARLAGRGRLPVVGLVTGEEEGSRFASALLGARALLGRAGARELDELADAEGVTLRQALVQACARGCAAAPAAGGAPFAPLFRPALALELHVEQGPVLERARCALGVVESIAGYRRWRLTLTGEARHSGTTPMTHRRDALAAAAEMILDAELLAVMAGSPAVATAGFVRPLPGLFNVVPGACELWLEIRHQDLTGLERMAENLETGCLRIAEHREIGIAIEEVSRHEPTALSPALAARAEAVAQELEIPWQRIVSGAAHDAIAFARAGIPALLLFVPSSGGISHAPEEFTPPDQLWAGCRFLEEIARRLSEDPPAAA